MHRVRERLVAGIALASLCLAVSCSEERGPATQRGKPPVIRTTTGIEMALIPGGWLEMGSNAEDQVDETPHRVYVSSFYMDKYEVTQEEYETVMHKNPSLRKGAKQPVEQIRWPNAAGTEVTYNDVPANYVMILEEDQPPVFRTLEEYTGR